MARARRQARKSPRYLVIALIAIAAFAFVAGIVALNEARGGSPTEALRPILLFSAFGALLTAALARSQAALLAALALTLVWHGVETFVSGINPHLWFFLPWGVALGLIYRHGWLTALRVGGWVCLGWCATVVLAPRFGDRAWLAGEQMALWQIYVFAGIALYILGRGMQWDRRWKKFAAPVITSGAVWSVAALFVLSFPATHRVGNAVESTALPAGWVFATAGVLVLVAALMRWRYRDTRLSTLPFYRQGAFVWLAVGATLTLANLRLVGQYAGFAAFGYNLLAFAGVIWLVLTGLERREPRIVSLGIGFFAVLVLARYYDFFWGQLDRPIFFAFGGLLALALGLSVAPCRRLLAQRRRKTERAI